MKRIVTLLLLATFFFGCESNNLSEKSIVKESKAEPFSLPSIPDHIIFCGQKIVLEDEDIRERLDREILTNAYYHSSTIQAIKRSNRYFPLIEKVLKEKGLPEDLKYVAVIESNLQQAVSPAGAVGFWQFMPVTAKQFGLKMNHEVDERMNIEKSTYAACEYLIEAYDTLKDWTLAIASYNRGIGGVRSDMRWQETDNYFDTYMNSETGRYVYRAMAMKLIMENPEAYGFHVPEKDLYIPLEIRKVPVNQNIDDLAVWSKALGYNLKIIKKLNPWILGNRLTPGNDPVVIEIPKKTFNLKPYRDYKE
jgi:membrane-bound lytic murein transglycosylase D